MSKIYVDEITGFEGTETGAPITLSGDTATLGSGATYNGTIGTSATGFGLITCADQWRITANSTGSSGDLTSNFERNDSDSFEGIGSAMTESSGIFSFPSTGIWMIIATYTIDSNSGATLYAGIRIYTTTDNSSYNMRTNSYVNHPGSSYYGTSSSTLIFNVTNTTTHKIKFHRDTSNSSAELRGHTDYNYNSFTFLRLGDT